MMSSPDKATCQSWTHEVLRCSELPPMAKFMFILKFLGQFSVSSLTQEQNEAFLLSCRTQVVNWSFFMCILAIKYQNDCKEVQSYVI